MFGLPDFMFYLIGGVIAAFFVSAGRTFGVKYIPNYPDMPLLFGQLIDWGKPEPEHTARIMGRYLHLATGALWGLLFGWLVTKQLFFVEFTVVSGILFGILPWLFLMTVLMPILGKGFFGVKISGYQWLLALLLHMVYGAVLGLLLSLFINQPF